MKHCNSHSNPYSASHSMTLSLYTVLLGICKKVKLVIIQTDLINVTTFFTIYDFYKLLSYSLANI